METGVESSPYIKFSYYFAKISGLAPFSFENNKLSHGSLCDRLWPFVALVIYVISQTGLILYRMEVDDGTANPLTRAGDILSFQVGLISLVISVVTVWFKSDDIIQITQSFATIDQIVESLGVKQEYRKKFKRHGIFAGLSSCLITITEIEIDVVTTQYLNLELTPLVISAMISGSLIYFVYHFIVFSFLSIMVLAKERYQQLNYVLDNFCPEEKKSFSFRRPRRIRANSVSPNSLSVNELPDIDFEILPDDELKPLQKLIKIEEMHGRLHDMTGQIIDLYSAPLLAVIGFYFTNIVTVCFYVYVGLMSKEDLVELREALMSLVWICPFVIELCAVAVVSTSVQSTGNLTPTVLEKVWIKHHPIEIIDEIQMLSLQLLQRPLTISAFGFFPLDYSYLYKIFCAVVAYFVIMVQLDTSNVDSSGQHTISTLNVTEMN